MYATWEEAKAQVLGYRGAKYKKFKRREDALKYQQRGDTEVRPVRRGGMPVVYTDGSWLPKSPFSSPSPPAGIGVWWGDEDSRNVSECVVAKDNIDAEIQATLRALEHIREPTYVATDCDHIVKSVHQWLPHWKENGFKRADGSAVQYVNELLAIEALLQRHGSHMMWVDGHAGIPGNMRAHALAFGAAKREEMRRKREGNRQAKG